MSTKLSELKATVTNIKDGAPGSDKGLWRLDSDGMPLPDDGGGIAESDADGEGMTLVASGPGTLLFRLRHLEAKVHFLSAVRIELIQDAPPLLTGEGWLVAGRIAGSRTGRVTGRTGGAGSPDSAGTQRHPREF